MECLIDYIGIKVCGNETSPSGQFINSLPGISLESVDKIADSEQITYAGVWKDVQAEAANRFYLDFINQLLKCYEIDVYCDYEAVICANRDRLTVAWKYLLGVQLMEFRQYSTRLNRFTLIDGEQAGQLKGLYEVKYEDALEAAMKAIDLGDCKKCCGGNPQTVTWLP